MEIDTHDPVPLFRTGVWRRKVVRKSSEQEEKPISDEDLVTGQHRYKFFHRPIPHEHAAAPDADNFAESPNDMQFHFPREFLDFLDEYNVELCTQGTQTDYRESETQTEPWDPPYCLKANTEPEVLTLAALSYGHGLPAGPTELEMIDRARKKKAWEASLPPVVLGDQKQWKKRQQMLAEKEKEDWEFRNKKVEQMQTEHLKLLDMALAEETSENELRNRDQLDRLWSKRKVMSEHELNKIQSKFSRDLRCIERRHKSFTSKNKIPSVDENQEPISAVSQYPIGDTAQSPDLQFKSRYTTYENKYLTTEKGLADLEEWLLENINMAMEPELQAAKKPPRPTPYQRLLYQTHQDILDSKKPPVKEAPPEEVKKLERPIIRPVTPTVENVFQSALDKTQATIVLQRLIRGRRLQKKMLLGREKKQDVIDELHSTHAIYQTELEIKLKKEQDKEKLYSDVKAKKDKEAHLDLVLTKEEGVTVSTLLNFRAREIQRLQEERRIHALIVVGERERRMREAAEAGLRQKEELTTSIQEEVHKQASSVHQDEAETFIEKLFSELIGPKRVTESKEEDKAEELAWNQLEAEEITSELHYAYLLPEVEKQLLRERNNQYQQKYRKEARKEIYSESASTSKSPKDEVKPENK